MVRDRSQLRAIVEKFERRIRAEHPGLGMALLVFDAHQRGEVPVAVSLLGINEEPAARLLHRVADDIVRAKAESPIILPPPGYLKVT